MEPSPFIDGGNPFRGGHESHANRTHRTDRSPVALS